MSPIVDSGYVPGDSAASRRLAITGKTGVSALFSNKKVFLIALFASSVLFDTSFNYMSGVAVSVLTASSDLEASSMGISKVSFHNPWL
jgi:hypothetical protein